MQRFIGGRHYEAGTIWPEQEILISQIMGGKTDKKLKTENTKKI
jgi:hypothetical protein